MRPLADLCALCLLCALCALQEIDTAKLGTKKTPPKDLGSDTEQNTEVRNYFRNYFGNFLICGKTGNDALKPSFYVKNNFWRASFRLKRVSLPYLHVCIRLQKPPEGKKLTIKKRNMDINEFNESIEGLIRQAESLNAGETSLAWDYNSTLRLDRFL